MADRIKYYLDEHAPRAVTEGLRRRGVDALTVQDAGLQGAGDEQHLAFAVGEGRGIFTQDADFLRLHAAGRPHRGIVYAPQQTPVGYVIRGLMLIYDVLAPEDMINQWSFYERELEEGDAGDATFRP